MTALILTVGVTFISSLLFPFAIKPWLVRMGVVDVPTIRSSHSTITIRGMGMTAVLATAVGYLVALLTGTVSADRDIFLVILAIAMVAAAVGWLEDLRGLSIRGRAGAQVGIGAAGSLILILLTDQSFWWWPLAAVAIAAYVNIANFMDGINGISSLHGLAVGGAYAVAGVISGQQWLIMGGAILAAAFLGFLPWNLGRSTVFLGDVGSYLLGAAIASLAVAGFLRGVHIEYVLSPLLVYLADTGYTLLRRVVAGKRWYSSHREHIFQRLTDVGCPHLLSAGIVTAATLVVTVLGFIVPSADLPVVVACAAGSAAVIGLYLASPTIIRWVQRRRQAAKLPVTWSD